MKAATIGGILWNQKLMILDIIEKYSEIILNYDIQKFKIVGASYRLACNITMMDQTRLFVKDYLFLDGSRKYSFHWQDENGDCILRWDNAPHHQNVGTFPYHKHIGKEENIEESQPMKVDTIMAHISSLVDKYGGGL